MELWSEYRDDIHESHEACGEPYVRPEAVLMSAGADAHEAAQRDVPELRGAAM